ncbi:MAG TPA: type II and III secretion system protein, partial [Bryobacteraceae bacterium]|nr:type II and III secretion system protein [Bryobacteraceae bacterium]
LATGSFLVPLSDKLFLVAKDTPQKRADLEPNVSVSVYLNEANSQQDMTALLQAVQQTAGLQKISLDTNTHMVVLRGPLSKVLPARAIIEQLMTPRAQVAVEMRLLEVSRNDLITYGINFPTLLSLTPLTTFLNNQPTFANSIAGLLTFGGGKTLMGIGILNPSLVATLSDSLGRVLVDSDVRSVSGQPASLHAGQRYPVLQAGYFGPSSFSGPGAYTPPPSFTYVDLGVTLKVTPMVQSMEDVLLDVDAEFMVLTGAAVNGIPVISNRLLKSKVALKFGQWAVIGGLLNTQDTRSITGLPGVSGIPGLGALTSTHDKNDSNDQVLVLMRPRLLTLPPSEMATQAYPLGSDTRPITPL